jgi:hypothetical protein
MLNIANLLMPNIEISMLPTITFHVLGTHEPKLTRSN